MAKDRLVPCLVHVPCQYPDGTPVEVEKVNLIFQVLDRQFGGSSNLGVIEGRWKGIKEPMLRIEVSVKESEVPNFERVAKQIGRSTKQKAMYVVINYRGETQILLVDEGDDLSRSAEGGA